MSAPLATRDLVAVRAALEAGASPAAALAEAGHGALAAAARRARLSGSVADALGALPTGDRGADLLVRALAVAERAGVGGADAVTQALRAVRDAALLTRLLDARTAQARVTARVLSAIPLVAWGLLIGLDRAALGFYATPLGAGLGALAVLLALGGRLWSGRIVTRAGTAGARADPLHPAPPPRDLRRAAVTAGPLLATLLLLGQPLLAVPAAAAVAALTLRPRASDLPDTDAGGAPETIELLAVAVGAGFAPAAAVTVCGELAPPAAHRTLAQAAARLAAGWGFAESFADGGLAELGDVLDVTQRWGAPAAAALQGLAEDLRAARRGATEEAAERVQVALVFPTTLLTLPAFVLAVVPPLVWTAFTG